MSGKGSSRRPQQVSDEQMLSAWEQIFGRKEEDTATDCDDDLRANFEDQHYSELEKGHAKDRI